MPATTSREAKLRSKRYGRMFSMLFFGIFFFVTGVIGLDIRRNASLRWAGRPLVWQAGTGLIMIALGAYWSRRLDDPRLERPATVPPPPKRVGSGRSRGAASARRQRLDS